MRTSITLDRFMTPVKGISIPFSSKTTFLVKNITAISATKKENTADLIPRCAVCCNVNRAYLVPIIRLSLNSSAVITSRLFSEMKEGLVLQVTLLSHDNCEILRQKCSISYILVDNAEHVVAYYI